MNPEKCRTPPGRAGPVLYRSDSDPATCSSVAHAKTPRRPTSAGGGGGGGGGAPGVVAAEGPDGEGVAVGGVGDAAGAVEDARDGLLTET